MPGLDDLYREIILDRALGEPAVAPDGTISQNGNPVGRIAIVRFDALAALVQLAQFVLRGRDAFLRGAAEEGGGGVECSDMSASGKR